MSIDVKCPGCGAEFTTNDEFAAQKTQCPDCGHEITIASPEGKAQVSTVAHRPAPPTPRESAKAAGVGKTEVAAPSPPAEQPPADESGRRARGRMVEYFRIALVIAVSLALVKIFEAGIHVVQQRNRATPRSIVEGAQARVQEIAKNAAKAPTLKPFSRRSRAIGVMPALPLLVLLGAMFLLAVRLILLTKTLDALYVTSPHWHERTLGGVTFYFLTTLGLVGLLAWAASLVKQPAAGDGLICGLLGAWLVASCLTALVAHVTSGDEFPHVTGRMVNDMVFGAGILILFTFGDRVPVPMSRASVTALLILLNFAIETTFSSVFVLDSPAVGRAGRRIGFLLLSILLIGGVGWILAVLGA